MTHENIPNEPQKYEPSTPNMDHNGNNVDAKSSSEFSHIEPVTPKKAHQEKNSFLDKAKDALSSLTQKEAKMSEKHVDEEIEEINLNHTSEKNPSAKSQHLKEKLTHPEKWKPLQILPPRYRRIVIILLLIILILCFIAWLKPDTKPVEAFETSEESVPTQFQPIAIQGLNDSPEFEILPAEEVPESDASNQDTDALMIQSHANDLSIPVNNHLNNIDDSIDSPAVAEEPIEPEQPEMMSNHSDTAEIPTPTKKTESIFEAAEKANLLNTQPAATNLRAQNIILRFRPGVSLMQLFREKHLNISDVIAMSKVYGAGNKLSQFKAGDKVHIVPGKDGHVAELILQDGSRFIRQNNGSYRFQN